MKLFNYKTTKNEDKIKPKLGYLHQNCPFKPNKFT